MKLPVFGILLFIAAVSAAADRSSWSVKDFVSPFVQLTKLKEYMSNIQCVREVVNNVMEKSDIKWEWKGTITNFDQIISVDLKKCLRMEGEEKEACKKQCIENSVGVLKEFLSLLFTDMRFDLMNKIRIGIVDECFPNVEKPSFFDGEPVDNAYNIPSLPAQFQCLADVLGEVSKKNGLEELWSKSQPQIQLHIYKWTECSEIPNKFARALCNAKEGYQTYKLITEYIQLAAIENPEAIRKIAIEYQQKCSSIALIDHFINVKLQNIKESEPIVKLRCIIEVVSEVVIDTDFEGIWLKYRADIEEVITRAKACASDNKWKAAKCVAKEIQPGYNILTKLYNELKETRREMYDKIIENVTGYCFANNSMN